MTTTPPDARNALAEIVAGLDGVTPGPWLVREYSHRPSGAGSGLRMVWDTDRRNMCLECVPAPVAHHIARLDPATIRSIAALVSSQDSRIAALEAQVEGMRVALKPFAEEAVCYDPDDGDNDQSPWATPVYFKIRDLRRARAALQSSETTGEK